ncbi:M20/M25/M40 family metallo-hydrolase [Cytobacillus spongiae]|uniref:M20/M25/M40 family metallo-hydrolase n=1 Tax=Cytobacillus spongiae TaxID=2901381 RepID=UPI001F1B4597|nr:M20/M25/M40 family metallo-hydrolase [Cytobacillus spongiae]UII57535.1 M20/M25/M40 family metallo-hydrolase [Cytobacillus spongiae]
MNVNWKEMRELATRYLSELIQLDTSNPGGNELRAVNWLTEKAIEHGIYYTIQETAPNRGNIILSTKRDLKEVRAPIVLMSHLDVVPAQGDDWTVPPFSGKVVDDQIWGRGAIDTKQLTVTHLILLMLVVNNQIKMKRDLLMIATSDEECGSHYGLLALLPDYSYLFHQSLVFNEGGGFPIQIGQKNYYLCEMGQKGIARLKITTRSERQQNPYLPNHQPISVITEVMKRFRNVQLHESIPPTTATLFQTIGDDLHLEHNLEANDIHSFLKNIPEELHSLMESIRKTTFTVTKWNGGRKHPSLHGESEVYIDGRPLPHITREHFHKMISTIVEGLPVSVEILEFSQGYETTVCKEDLRLFEEVITTEVKNARVVPFLSFGASDSRHLRTYDCQVYGYCPMLPDMTFEKVIKLVHGRDERIPVDSLLFGIQNMAEIVQRKGVEVCEAT